MGIAERFANSGGYVAARRIGRFDRSRGGIGETRRVPRRADFRIRSADRSAAQILIGSRRKPAAPAWRAEASRGGARTPDRSAAEARSNRTRLAGNFDARAR